MADYGSGCASEVRGSIFDEGFTTKGSDSHAGIGLTLVSDAVDTLGGSIHVEDGKGTVFTVVIPDAFAPTQSLVP